MTAKIQNALNAIRQFERKLETVYYSDKVAAVLFHIWARSVIAAPNNFFRKRWLVKLPIELIMPFFDIFAFFFLKKAGFLRMVRSIALTPFTLVVILVEIITDGRLSKWTAEQHIIKGDQIDLSKSASGLTGVLVIGGLPLMQEPFLSQADSISELQENSSSENFEDLMNKIEEYWNSQNGD